MQPPEFGEIAGGDADDNYYHDADAPEADEKWNEPLRLSSLSSALRSFALPGPVQDRGMFHESYLSRIRVPPFLKAIIQSKQSDESCSGVPSSSMKLG